MRLKYRNKPTYVGDIRFASKKEAGRYIELKFLEKDKQIEDLELQPTFKFPMGFSYRADFSYKQDGKLIIEDVKGFLTPTFRLKEKCFRYFYPELKLLIT